MLWVGPWKSSRARSHAIAACPISLLCVQTLTAAGLEVERPTPADLAPVDIAFFRERLAAGAPPRLGTHILMGTTTREKARNVLAGLEDGALAFVLMIARRRPGRT